MRPASCADNCPFLVRPRMTAPEHPHAPPLWRLLQAAGAMLLQVRAGHSLTDLLAAQPQELRAGAQALVFHALRWLGLAEGLRSVLVQRRPPASTDALLCVALALLAEPGPVYAVHTLIDQTVEAAKRSPDMRGHARLLNACLRRYAREGVYVYSLTAYDARDSAK